MNPRKYDWPDLQVDDCRMFHITGGEAEMCRIRTSAYTWAYQHDHKVSCWHLYGVILFVVRHPDESATVDSPQLESTPCLDDPSETKCRAWRLYVPTGPRLGRRPLLAPKVAPRWDQRHRRRSERHSRLPVYTVSPSGQVQLQQPR